MKIRRKEIGISAEEVASALGVSVATVYRYENGEIEKVPGTVLEPLARVLKTTPAYLMGWDDALLESVKEESESGRTQAKEDMYRTFGIDHSALDIRLLGDKAAVIYYKAMDQRAVPELTSIIQTVDRKDYREMEKLRILLQSYLRADVPIQEIVDTALKPYREDDSLHEGIG